MPVKFENIRKNILTIAKSFEVGEKKGIDLDKFNEDERDKALKKVCKVDFSSLKNIDEIEKYTNLMQR